VSDKPSEEPPSFWFWSGYGFWQLLPSTFSDYELPELTPEEQVEAAMRYIKKHYHVE
jgi:SLT domain-containing protein